MTLITRKNRIGNRSSKLVRGTGARQARKATDQAEQAEQGKGDATGLAKTESQRPGDQESDDEEQAEFLAGASR
jgi:hypothetical protein